jgi:hypothetical protein
MKRRLMPDGTYKYQRILRMLQDPFSESVHLVFQPFKTLALCEVVSPNTQLVATIDIQEQTPAL